MLCILARLLSILLVVRESLLQIDGMRFWAICLNVIFLQKQLKVE